MTDEDIFSTDGSNNPSDDLDEFLGGASANLDFTKADIPEDTYLTTIKRVEMQLVEPSGDKNGKFQLVINMQLDTSDYDPQKPWHGQYFTDYMYLGKSVQEVGPLSLKKLQAFIGAAMGQKPEGVLDWRQYSYYKDSEGRRCLGLFEGLPVGIQLVKETGSDGIERLKAKAYKNAENLEHTSVEFGDEPI